MSKRSLALLSPSKASAPGTAPPLPFNLCDTIKFRWVPHKAKNAQYKSHERGPTRDTLQKEWFSDRKLQRSQNRVRFSITPWTGIVALHCLVSGIGSFFGVHDGAIENRELQKSHDFGCALSVGGWVERNVAVKKRLHLSNLRDTNEPLEALSTLWGVH